MVSSLNSHQSTLIMKAGYITWFLAIIYVTGSQLSPDDIARHLTSSVTVISKKHFHPGRLLALDAKSASRVDDLVLERLHYLSIWPILLLNVPDPATRYTDQHHALQESREKSLSYVFLTDVLQLSQQVHNAHAHPSWNPRARFLVVVTDLVERNISQTTRLARRILATLWERQVVNAVVLLASSHQSGPMTLDVYTWFPFQETENCANEVLEVTLLDRWLMEGNGTFLQGEDLYPQKVPKNLHGCPLRVTIFQVPPFVVEILPRTTKGSRFDGLEVQLLQTLSGVFNFTIIFHLVPNTTLEAGILLPNGTWTGVFNDLISERVNISLGCLMPTVESYRVFDFTKDYTTNAIVWVVPKAQPAARWRSLYKIFTPLTWLVLILVYSVLGLVMWLLARRTHPSGREPSTYTTLSASYQIVFGIHLAVSAPRQPRTYLLRMFFLLVAFYCLWIDTAYQSSLISSLTQVNTVKQITTLSELLDSDLPIGVHSDYDRLFEVEDPNDRRVLERIVTHCGYDILRCLKRVSKGRLAVLGNRALVQFHKDGKGLTPFRIFRSDAFTYFVGMAMPKGSILLDPFNNAIRRFNQAHFIPKWRNDLSKRFKAHSIKKPKYIAKTIKTSFIFGPQRLTVMHLEGAFVLLFEWCGYALVVFIVEVALNRFHNRSTTSIAFYALTLHAQLHP